MSVQKRILLIGATGMFGSQLARGLCSIAGAELVLTSRSLAKAQALAAGLAAATGNAKPQAAAFDTRGDAAAFFALWRPWLVIDASGPFQGAGYDLPRAAIASGAYWLDLADARDYVLGFATALDAQARAAGLAALTGASTTPALSGAAVRALTQDWQRIDAVETAVLPGGSSLVGPAVLAAILSRAGAPIAAFDAGRLTQVTGWGSARRVDLPGVGRRWASPVEVADPELFAQAFNVRGRIDFDAGLESWLEHFGLLGLAWLRCLGFIRKPERLAAILERARRVTAKLGSTTGGMTVTASGLDAHGRWRKVRWTLLAHKGQGPAVPTLPALALARQFARGAEAEPGARPAHEALDLAAIEAEMAPYDMESKHETLAAFDKSLFETALGADYAKLPAIVQRLHAADGEPVWQGRASITRGASPMAWLTARLVGFPPTNADVPVTVSIERGAAGETWTRDFGGRRFGSHLSLAGGRLSERFGLLTFGIALGGDTAGVAMPVAGWRFFALPLPAFLAPRSQAFETQDDEGRFCFDVRLSLPLGIALVHYRGWLMPAPLTVS